MDRARSATGIIRKRSVYHLYHDRALQGRNSPQQVLTKKDNDREFTAMEPYQSHSQNLSRFLPDDDSADARPAPSGVRSTSRRNPFSDAFVRDPSRPFCCSMQNEAIDLVFEQSTQQYFEAPTNSVALAELHLFIRPAQGTRSRRMIEFSEEQNRIHWFDVFSLGESPRPHPYA
jgi:hypothetical protein